MISVINFQSLNAEFRQGTSERAIKRKLGISRKTVRHYHHLYNLAVAEGIDSLEEYLQRRPKYKSRPPQPNRLTEEVCKQIDGCLEENVRKQENGQRKLVMLNRDIHAQLQSSGHTISYPTVCRYIAQKKASYEECFIRQDYLPGTQCEFDWGELRLQIAGLSTKLYISVFTLCYSNHRYARLHLRQDTLAYKECHVDYMRDVGIPTEMVYDNMRTAVKSFVGHTKTPTSALLQMEAFYGFTHRFCNARRGNEKGHVERSVEFVRRKAFATRQEFSSIEEAQQWLSHTCEELNRTPHSPSTKDIVVRAADDLMALRHVEGSLSCQEMVDRKIDKYGVFTYESNHYSVPDHLVGKTVSVKVYSTYLKIYYDHKIVARHERLAALSGGWRFDLQHYLPTLLKKPGALHASCALQQAPIELQELFNVHFRDAPQDFVQLLIEAKEKGYTYEQLIAAKTHYASTRIHLNKDIILSYIEDQKRPSVPTPKPQEKIEDAAFNTLINLTQLMNNTDYSKTQSNGNNQSLIPLVGVAHQGTQFAGSTSLL